MPLTPAYRGRRLRGIVSFNKKGDNPGRLVLTDGVLEGIRTPDP